MTVDSTMHAYCKVSAMTERIRLEKFQCQVVEFDTIFELSHLEESMVEKGTILGE
jgi:hypothetical protein